ncbi:hypothetical protein GWK47_023724 [Chionoecetes opilio]|uniref:Uncharacterized protein n=1 Tax=Chionoecetes opilio TaxID=41210 RepID=A0A8J5CG86_CHIOP|nr:hypothetical protein GWK47_023724 [Chionoecetes opilio]
MIQMRKDEFVGSGRGAVDGKPIHIQKSALGSSYSNDKSTFSTILMGVADAAYRFIYLDVDSYDREHDGIIFAESLEVLVMALEALHEEAKPLGLKVSWFKTRS